MSKESDSLELDPVLPSEIFRSPPRRVARTRGRELSPRAPAPPRSRSHRVDEAAAPEAGLVQPGAILDKYRIEELLGTGGFAAVYRATHLLLQVPVALKLLRPRVLARDPHLVEELVREARFAARIDHPNVVRVYDATHSAAITYIVMEFIDGGSLARRLAADGPLRPAQAFQLAIDVAEGLRAGLRQGLVHRDIKPGNVLLSRRGGAKIVDFGLAYAGAFADSARTPGPALEPIIGTRGYMAPEQVRAPSRVDFRADVYSLGVTLLEALTGRMQPRSRGSARARPALAELLELAPHAAVPLLRRMLSEEPGARAASYSELLEELRACAARLASP